MRKAYDIILQSEVSANLAAQNNGFESYRYECACCGEEVYIAAQNSTRMVAHFKHRNGNNDIECENYLGQYGAISVDSRSRRSNRERVEFYYDNNNRTFNIGLRFSENEIQSYEQQDADFEIRITDRDKPFYTLKINNRNFASDIPTLIPLNNYSIAYYLSNTYTEMKRKYVLFNNNKPTFFKIQGNDNIDYKGKLVRGTALYTKIQYFVVFPSQRIITNSNHLPSEIKVDDTFSFETMSRRFLGKVFTIEDKTAAVDSLISSWGYKLEASETLTLLWPPISLIDGISMIDTDYAFLRSSFELQAHGNINVHPEDIKGVVDGISKVSVKAKTKVYKKNAEIVIDKSKKHHKDFDNLSVTKRFEKIYAVRDDSTYFLFNRSGVTPLSKGQSILFTPHCEIRHYTLGYPVEYIYPQQQNTLTGRQLLDDLLANYKRTESFSKVAFGSCELSDIAAQYIERCRESGVINSSAKRFIEEGQI